MTTVGSVEDYDELRGLDITAGGLDIVLVRQQKASTYPIPLTSPPNGGIFVWDKNTDEPDDGGTIIAPGGGDLRRWKRQFDDKLSVMWFGAKGDMKEYFVCTYEEVIKPDNPGKPSITITRHETRRYQGKVYADSSQLNLTLPSPPKEIPPGTGFDENDVGKTIIIWNGSMRFITKINVYHNSETVELAESPKENIPGAFIAWGTDDSVPIQQAIDVGKELGFTIYLPPGHFLITKTLRYVTKKPYHKGVGTNTHELMPHGLRFLGAGMYVSFLHNEIMDENQMGDASIRFDGEIFTGKYFSFQYGGLLKDFSMTSTGSIMGSMGIDMREVWNYTIENISVLGMGSHAIVLRNSVTPLGYRMGLNTDGDACEMVHIDNVHIIENGGWGIIVDAERGCNSTARIHIERCRLEHNRGGGIQWLGQQGMIERSGLYGNGVIVDPKDGPKAVEGAYGIFGI